jgi:hypothetical protein
MEGEDTPANHAGSTVSDPLSFSFGEAVLRNALTSNFTSEQTT